MRRRSSCRFRTSEVLVRPARSRPKRAKSTSTRPSPSTAPAASPTTESLRVPRRRAAVRRDARAEIKPLDTDQRRAWTASHGLHHAGRGRPRSTTPASKRCTSYDPATRDDQVRLLHPQRSSADLRRPSGSLNGRFMTYDGRAFFSTTDSLVPADANGIIDVYEFVDGRPQLISTGTGDNAGNEFQPTGLAGVSADGIDVFFSTYETLVGQDENGAQLKFYDARTNGGFPFDKPPAPCEAADECHGDDSSAPATLRRSARPRDLGNGGNFDAPGQEEEAQEEGRSGREEVRQSEASATREWASVVERETNREMTEHSPGFSRTRRAAGALALLIGANADSAGAKSDIFAYRQLPIDDAGRRTPGHLHRIRTRQPADGESAEPVLTATTRKSSSSTLPAGVIANPHVVSECKIAQLALFECPADSQAGIVALRLFGYGASRSPSTPQEPGGGVRLPPAVRRSRRRSTSSSAREPEATTGSTSNRPASRTSCHSPTSHRSSGECRETTSTTCCGSNRAKKKASSAKPIPSKHWPNTTRPCSKSNVPTA